MHTCNGRASFTATLLTKLGHAKDLTKNGVTWNSLAPLQTCSGRASLMATHGGKRNSLKSTDLEKNGVTLHAAHNMQHSSAPAATDDTIPHASKAFAAPSQSTWSHCPSQTSSSPREHRQTCRYGTESGSGELSDNEETLRG